MELDLSRFRETFFQEAAEHLDALESGLLALRTGNAGADTLHAVFRAAHSIKAGAATFGFAAITRLIHVLESLLDLMRNGEVEPSPTLLELLLRAVDSLRLLVDAAARAAEPAAGWEEMTEELDRARIAGNSRPKPEERAQAEYAIEFQPGADLFRLGLDPLLVLRDLARLGALSAEADLSRMPPLAEMDPETCCLGWRLRLRTAEGMDRIRDAFAFVEDVAALSIEPARAAVAAADRPPERGTRAALRDTLRVPTGKVDQLINLVGELVIAQSMAAQIMNGFTPDRLPRLEAAMADLEHYTRELQDGAMRIRMTPVGTIFSRFPRLVHDAGRALGKQVALEISGEETELDKGVVEQIADPLTHLVRNAVDHGLETPDERLRAGKPAEGRLRLSAMHRGGSVILEVSDDGRGLNTARIRAKGIERGWIGEAEELTDEQIHALIFRPGFSTSETVNDMSGRGVGMDVVKKSVDALKGTVSIETGCGRGCTVRIRLPLTLAILDGLLLRVGAQTYVMPLVSIVESVRPRQEQVRNMAGQAEVVMVRQEPLPLLRLGRLFDVPAEVADPARGLVVIVEHEGRRLALLVDELLGQQQVVVKSLEANFRKVEGITGATILGDGRAALILDMAGLVAMSCAA